MLFWVILIVLISILWGQPIIINRRYNNLRYYFGCTIMILVAILRFDVGYDYIAYYPLILKKQYDFEPLSNLICIILEGFRYPPITIGTFALLSCVLAFSTIKKFSYNIFLGALIYGCILYLPALTTIRQGLAVTIVFWGIRYIYSKSFIKYIVVCLIAFLIHSSAFIGVLIYLIYWYVPLKRLPLVIMLIFVFVSIILNEFIGLGFYARVSEKILEIQNGETEMNNGGGLISYVFPLFDLIAIILYLVKKGNIKSSLISIICIGSIFPFLLGSHYGVRISEYFNIYYCIVFPHLLSFYKPRLRILATYGFCLYFLALIYAGRGQRRSSFLPYRTIFSIEDINNPKFRQP